MAKAPLHCSICNTKMTAVFVDLKAYDEHDVPAWNCATCNLSMPVLGIDRHRWVDSYDWEPPGLVYGSRIGDRTKCRGCMTSTLQAGIDFTMTEIFPFWETRQPSWICYRCGFCDRVVYADRYIWADHYEGWK